MNCINREYQEIVLGECVHKWEYMGKSTFDLKRTWKCKHCPADLYAFVTMDDKEIENLGALVHGGIPDHSTDRQVFYDCVVKYKLTIMPDCEIVETVPDDNGLRQELIEWWDARTQDGQYTAQDPDPQIAAMRAVIKLEKKTKQNDHNSKT